MARNLATAEIDLPETPAPGTDLVNYQAMLLAELKDLSKTVAAPSGAKISVKGKVFTLPSGQQMQGPLRAIILDWRNVNMYYEGVYNPNQLVKPTCVAVNKDIDGLAPMGTVSNPQAPSCGECQKNTWGSDPKGGKGKACKNTVQLALVLDSPGMLTEQSTVYTISVSPTGVSSWANFVNKLKDLHGLLTLQLVSELSFVPASAFPTLVFAPTEERVPEAKFPVVFALRKAAQTLLDKPIESA